MLRALDLRDFVLAASVSLRPAPGLNVLTGETGAGKSLLVEALSLLAGDRADGSRVRAGAERALVQAEFGSDDGEALVAARSIAAEGRNVARLDGEVVTVAELAEATGARIAVFAQHAHQALLAAAAQRDALDRLLDPDASEALRAYRSAFRARKAAQERLAALQDSARERARRRDEVERQRREIDDARVQPGETQELARETQRLTHAEAIATGVRSALATLEEEGGALGLLAHARRALSAAARHDDRLEALARELSDALTGSEAVAAELDRFLSRFDEDPLRLDEVHARTAQLQRLFAKYGEDEAAVLNYRSELEREAQTLLASDDQERDVAAQVAQLHDETTRLAAQVRSGRERAARRLEREIAPHLARLALPDGRLTVRLEPVDAGPNGSERVVFQLAANRGERPAPLAQAASGGELSRVMLALWLVTGSDRPTLVFDEVDAGVGGRAALAVGESLATLAERHQVLVVTHLAQVAAFADRQFHVGKETRAGRTVTTVAAVEGDERLGELARMSTGSDGDAARHAARELLAAAVRKATPPTAGRE